MLPSYFLEGTIFFLFSSFASLPLSSASLRKFTLQILILLVKESTILFIHLSLTYVICNLILPFRIYYSFTLAISIFLFHQKSPKSRNHRFASSILLISKKTRACAGNFLCHLFANRRICKY